jgi:hypothetical protein
MTQAQSLIAGLCRQAGFAQWYLDQGEQADVVAQRLALQAAALAVAHAPRPASVVKQVGADAAGVVRVPVVGVVGDGGRVAWGAGWGGDGAVVVVGEG